MLFQNKIERPNLFEPNIEPSHEKQNLFDEGFITDKKEEEIEDEEISVKTPTIRVLTPVKKKKINFENIFEGAKFEKMFPMPHIKKVDIDCSDEDEVNERVRKLVGNSNNVDYSNEPDIIIEACKDMFEIKYKSLVANYPDYAVKFNKEKNLNSIHKNYHTVIRSIYAHMNIGQTQLSYILILLVTEVIGIKVFNLPLAGLTKMEMKRMYKHNALMIELGESLYPGTGEGGEPQSIEWRIGTSFLWNIVIFLGLKLLSSYMGGEGMIDSVRTIVDKLFENNINTTNIESGEAKKINAEENELFSGLFEGGDGTSEIAEFISSLGSSFTQNMENNRKGPKPRNRKRPIFD